MERKNLYLKNEDLINLKEIGYGTDGAIYFYKNNLLIKLYHKRVQKIITPNNSDDDMKIYTKGSFHYKNYYNNDLTYYTYNKDENESIRLLPKEALNKAIEKRNTIKLTSLPLGTVFLNEHLAGCLIERKRGIQIHKLIGLPLRIRKKIYLNVLKSEAELLKYNVYHIDLANSPWAKKEIILPNNKIVRTGHSHVLVNPFTFNTQFIDLEGKSTIYTEKENDYLKKRSLNNLAILTLEFLLQINWEEYKEDSEEMIPLLEKKKVPEKMIEKLIAEEMNEIDDFYELSLNLKK